MRNGKKRTRAERKKLVAEAAARELTRKAFAQGQGLTLARRLRREAHWWRSM